MKLTFEDVKGITVGAVAVKEENGEITFHRFTVEQEAFFKNLSDRHYTRALCSAGVILRFETDSESLFLKVGVALGSSATWFSLDVHVNGERIGSICNFDEGELPERYSALSFELGEYSGNFQLGKGKKTVEIYLPYGQITTLYELLLSNNAFIWPIRKEKLMLTYGDSITQGYNALHSDKRYAARISSYLGADELCKAISGDCFRPKEVEMSENILPDFISVAYGTNDWGSDNFAGRSEHDIEKSCRVFCENLRNNYPWTPIFVITPIWRKMANKTKNSGTFWHVAEIIEKAAKGIDNVKIIYGKNLVPHEHNLFGDFALHPSDKGFDYYTENLINELKKLGY